MSFTKFMLPFIFSISILSACSPSQDTAKSRTQTDTSELESDTQRIMQTDLSEQTQNDEIPLSSEPEPSQESNETESIAQEQLQEQFDIRVYRAESQGTMTGYIDKVDIISLNDQPTTITGIQINRGSCGITRMYDYQNMRYGSVALAYPRCKVEYIQEINITTANGTYAYRIG
ncbi:hypothetical protein MMP64_11575 [Acinetobacter sp. ANC 5659]|uniref:hypothetical protein n=1 Tax=Acinetobacter higginsii TaxID=70347 RepID=UPI001F4B9A49|nr:hypothetical protein [Acinetobacter higginsii]MCH7318569.1 hypothetical protein [Acinetobacter higginsii]